MIPTTSPWGRLETLHTTQNLSDKLWRGYATYVSVHCPRDEWGTGWILDETAEELFDLAQNWDILRTF